jgi:hypothetical protein
MMQQTVLLTGIRGPDGITKYGSVKMLLRWYRRCVLLSAMDGKVLPNPYDNNGGSFTGPSLGVLERTGECFASNTASDSPTTDWETQMDFHVDAYLRDQDALPHHFQAHFMQAAEILGYKHPDMRVRVWWRDVYQRLVNSLHLHAETEAELDERLGDSRSGWLKRADTATVA